MHAEAGNSYTKLVIIHEILCLLITQTWEKGYRGTLSQDDMSSGVELVAHVYTTRSLSMTASLSKIETIKRDANPPNLWTFMKGFKVNIANRANDDTQWLTHLIRYCEGIRKDSIEHYFCQQKENVTLKRSVYHIGSRPHDIVKELLTGLINGLSLHQDDIAGLKRLIRHVDNCKVVVSQIRRDADLNCSTNIKWIVKRLSRNI